MRVIETATPRFIALYAIGYVGSYIALITPVVTTLAIKIEQIDPVGKEASLGLIAALGALMAIVANLLTGALSDRTRSQPRSQAAVDHRRRARRHRRARHRRVRAEPARGRDRLAARTTHAQHGAGRTAGAAARPGAARAAGEGQRGARHRAAGLAAAGYRVRPRHPASGHRADAAGPGHRGCGPHAAARAHDQGRAARSCAAVPARRVRAYLLDREGRAIRLRVDVVRQVLRDPGVRGVHDLPAVLHQRPARRARGRAPDAAVHRAADLRGIPHGQRADLRPAV